jgi:ABC-type amino acid transport substrate-binding protein
VETMGRTWRRARPVAGRRARRVLCSGALAVAVLVAAASLAACGSSSGGSGTSGGSSPAATSSSALTADEQAWLADKGTLTVGAFNDYPPFGFVDSGGQAAGIAVDYWKHLAEHLGVQVQFKPEQFDSQLNDLKAGAVDSLQGIFPLESRKQWFAFTGPYLDIPTRIYTDGATGATSLDALKGMKVAVVKGDSGQELADDAGLRTLVVAGYPEAVKAVAKGKAQAAILDQLVGDYLINKLGYQDKVHASGAPVADGQMTLPVKKDDTMLLGILRKGQQMVSEDEVNEFVQKWVGK